MTAPANDDRRKNPRHFSDSGYLQVNGQQALLIDWSFGGIGVQFESQIEFEISSDVEIMILDKSTDQWELLTGVVKWVEQDRKVGIEFSDTDQRLVGILLRLLGNRLAELPH